MTWNHPLSIDNDLTPIPQFLTKDTSPKAQSNDTKGFKNEKKIMKGKKK
jgi:hypothetical protein